MTDSTSSSRDTAIADAVTAGVERLLADMGFATLREFTLASGRRADVIGLARDGRLMIVEVKSSIADFRSDQKWPDYRDFCDSFAFAVAPDFPHEILPEDCGLILADKWAGDLIRPDPQEGPASKLAAARRKAVTLRFARTAAGRLSGKSEDEGSIPVR